MIIKQYLLSFGKFDIYEKFMVGTVHYGVHLDKKMIGELLLISDVHFKGAFGYISNRIHSYSVDPFNYKEVDKLPNFKALAIVGNTNLSKDLFSIEKDFFNGPMAYFEKMDDAILWMKEKC